MKEYKNRNIYWTSLFVNECVKAGIKNVCISPGSRNTPLTAAFAEAKEIKKHVIVDERSSGFFALGLSRQSGGLTAVVTTSGTAVAELYPALIEAYFERIPLLVCTADRPSELQNCGANQTINQHNIYANHIRQFADAGLPELTLSSADKLIKTTRELISTALYRDRGPVHFNFPFRKPLEPECENEIINTSLIEKIQRDKDQPIAIRHIPFACPAAIKERVMNAIVNSSHGIIFTGSGHYEKEDIEAVSEMSQKLGMPLLADGNSPFRFMEKKYKNIIFNHSAFLRAGKVRKSLNPGLILQFGNAPVSSAILNYFRSSDAFKVLVNPYNDWKDPSNSADIICQATPADFANNVISSVAIDDQEKRINWLDRFSELDYLVGKIKKEHIFEAEFPFEGRIVQEVIKIVPDNSVIFAGNSMPVRDIDFFAESSDKRIDVYSNRGASGIDGLISTAAGLAAESDKPLSVITGDLSFFHDINGMWALRNSGKPVIIFLIDNEGGGIFQMLPISKNQKLFNTYFKTPLNLDFESVTRGFGGNFYTVNNWKELEEYYNIGIGSKTFSVLHIKTDPVISSLIRKGYWEKVKHFAEPALGITDFSDD